MHSLPLLARCGALLAAGALALWLAGCAGGPSTPGAGTLPGQLSGSAPEAATPYRGPPAPSQARSEREYRQDAARHVYALNASHIYAGKLPPMLYAVGTLQVHLDARGQVKSFHWLRAPRHAPDAIAAIERTVRAAAPFPVATRLGAVVWTDTWLWEEDGHFQLDTLSEGQL